MAHDPNRSFRHGIAGNGTFPELPHQPLGPRPVTPPKHHGIGIGQGHPVVRPIGSAPVRQPGRRPR